MRVSYRLAFIFLKFGVNYIDFGLLFIILSLSLLARFSFTFIYLHDNAREEN